MREIKFRYVWGRPQKYAGPYSPKDPKYQIAYLTLDQIEKADLRLGNSALRGEDRRWSILVARNQFTGLKDKNGVEIYEGDIVKWLGWEVSDGKQIRPERIIVIGMDDGWITDCFYLQNVSSGNSRMTQEVIGNIYENEDINSHFKEGHIEAILRTPRDNHLPW